MGIEKNSRLGDDFKGNIIYRKYIKRLMDIVLSFLALVILSPIILILAILVRFNLGSPVLFKQRRPGLHGKVFTMYKFRSMTDARDEKGELLSNDERLTKFGKILRASSMDELPGLFNILVGDMSIVGPRPLLVKYLELYNDHQKKRHNVRPGLTGLAQASGRNAISWEKRFDLDVEYVENISFILDLKIILKTVKKVFAKEGINFQQNKTIYETLAENKLDKERNE